MPFHEKPEGSLSIVGAVALPGSPKSIMLQNRLRLAFPNDSHLSKIENYAIIVPDDTLLLVDQRSGRGISAETVVETVLSKMDIPCIIKKVRDERTKRYFLIELQHVANAIDSLSDIPGFSFAQDFSKTAKMIGGVRKIEGNSEDANLGEIMKEDIIADLHTLHRIREEHQTRQAGQSR